MIRRGENVKENQSPADALKRGMGTGYDIDMAVAAMATAAGFDARMAKFALDNADAPQPFSAGQVVKYEAKIMVEGGNKALILQRAFRFDGLVFPTQTHSALKQVFNTLHESDNHTITLKQAAASR